MAWRSCWQLIVALANEGEQVKFKKVSKNICSWNDLVQAPQIISNCNVLLYILTIQFAHSFVVWNNMTFINPISY